MPTLVCDLDTPVVLIDLDVMERNLTRAATYAREHCLRLRPHTKTHKIPAIGRLQLESGAVGLTVAKAGEAEVMLKANPPDLLLAYPVIGEQKLKRLVSVARRTRLTIALDSMEAARPISMAAEAGDAKIGVLAEVDLGLYRVGVSPGKELVQLIRGISALPRLSYEGIAFYPGHIVKMDENGQRQFEQLSTALLNILVELDRARLAPKIVSGGSAATLYHSHRLPGLNEIRPGTYLFNDRNTLMAEACLPEECAVTVLTTVVSTARPGQAVVDGGSKTFSSDRPPAAPDPVFGYVREAPGAVFHRMHEEHGYLDIRKADRTFSVGDRIHIIPNHVCAVMNLHDTVYGIRNGRVEMEWRVEGRGKLQ